MTPQESPQLEKELRSLLECRHNIPADRCAHCRGRTASGKTMEVVTEDFIRSGSVVVQMEEKPKKSKPNYRNLKTVIGIGLGVTVFTGFAFWQGGKLILRLIRKDKDEKTAGHS